MGRFTSRDEWVGDNLNPITLNKYLYANGNPGSYLDPDGRIGFLSDLRDRFNETDEILRQYAENTPYVGGAVGLLRGVTSLGSAPFRAVNTASDAVAGALPFEATSGVANEGAAAFGESVDTGAYVANNKAAVANAIKDKVIDTSSRTFFDRDGAAASDFVSGVTQLVIPSPAIVGGVANTVGRLTPSVARGLQTAGRGLAAVRDRVAQAFRVAESPSGSPEMRFDTDGEAGSGFLEHEVLSASPAAAAFSDRTIIRVDSNGTATIHVGPHRLGPYSEVAGHHPHQQAARSNNPNYNPQSAITLADDGTFDHTTISRMQLKLNAEARRSGLEYTLAVEEAIQRQAMAAGKILDEDVLAILKLSRKDLQSQGALEPTRIPGARKGN